MIPKYKTEASANGWDKYFIKELQKRSKEFASGKAKNFTWEETKQAAINRMKLGKK